MWSSDLERGNTDSLLKPEQTGLTSQSAATCPWSLHAGSSLAAQTTVGIACSTLDSVPEPGKPTPFLWEGGKTA